VFQDPGAFSDISRWAEEASKEKAKHEPKPKTNP
jgi:hypothetical protein